MRIFSLLLPPPKANNFCGKYNTAAQIPFIDMDYGYLIL